VTNILAVADLREKNAGVKTVKTLRSVAYGLQNTTHLIFRTGFVIHACEKFMKQNTRAKPALSMLFQSRKVFLN